MTASAGKKTVRVRRLCLQGWEVDAILDGRKSQLRVPVDPAPSQDRTEPGRWTRWAGRALGYESNWRLEEVRHRETGALISSREYLVPRDEWLAGLCPLGRPGDRVSIREKWAPRSGLALSRIQRPFYAAEAGRIPLPPGYRWRSSTSMPAWASRLTLRVVSVRVERLRAITRDDAAAEGIPEYGHDFRPGMTEAELDEWRNRSTVENFAVVWDAAHAASWRNVSWAEDPEVWRVEFEPEPGPYALVTPREHELLAHALGLDSEGNLERLRRKRPSIPCRNHFATYARGADCPVLRGLAQHGFLVESAAGPSEMRHFHATRRGFRAVGVAPNDDAIAAGPGEGRP